MTGGLFILGNGVPANALDGTENVTVLQKQLQNGVLVPVQAETTAQAIANLGGGGGGGSPGAPTTSVQYNNAGAFGGISGVTSNGVAMTFAAAALLLAGSVSGTVTLNAPSSGGGVLALPAGSDTLVSLTATQTLTNKSLTAPNLDTPISLTLTNATGLPLSTGVTGNLPVTNLNSGTSASSATFWRGDGTWATPAGSGGITIGTTTISGGTTTRLLYDAAGVVGEISNVTSNGTNIALGTPLSGVMTNVTGLPLTSGVTGILPAANGGTGIANSKTLTVSNNLTLAGTDATVMTFPSTSATIARTDATQTFTGVQTFGTPIAAGSGGTGVANNAASTIAISGNFGTTLTVSGTTAITLPTSGTLAVLGANTFTAAQTAPAYIVGSTNVNAQTGTTYTLVSGDNGKVVTLSNAGAITVTVPSGLGAGFACTLVQLGAGQVGLTASGTTINSDGTLTHLKAQYAAGSLYAYAADTFVFAGDRA